MTLIADILMDAVYKNDGSYRYNTVAESVRAYEGALRRCYPEGHPKIAELLADFKARWAGRLDGGGLGV